MRGRDRSSLPLNTGNFCSKNSTRRKPSATGKARSKALAFPGCELGMFFQEERQVSYLSLSSIHCTKNRLGGKKKKKAKLDFLHTRLYQSRHDLKTIILKEKKKNSPCLLKLKILQQLKKKKVIYSIITDKRLKIRSQVETTVEHVKLKLKLNESVSSKILIFT